MRFAAASSSDERLRRAGALVALLALLAAAIAARTLPLVDLIFPQKNDVRLLGVDSYYHLRHARFAADHFPRLQRWDAWTHYPRGQRSDAVGLFTLTIAAGALVTGSDADDLAVARAAAWTPVAVYSLVVLAFYWACRGVLTRRLSLLGCALLILYPGPSLWRGVLGFADHHVAEMLLALLTVGAIPRALRAETVPWSRCWRRPLLWQASPLAVFLFTWLGAPIYVVLAGATWTLIALVEIARGVDPSATAQSLVRYSVAVCLLAVPVALVWPDLVLSPTKFWWAIAAVAGQAGGLCLLRLVGKRLLDRGLKGKRAAIVLLLAAVAAVASAVTLVPQGRHWVYRAFAPKELLVQENLAAALTSYWYLFGAVGFLALAAWPLAFERSIRDGAARLALAPATAGALILTASWSASDYEYVAAAFVPFLAVLALDELAPLVRNARSRWLPVGLALLFVAPVWPLRWTDSPLPTRANAERLLVFHDGWREAMRWMRDHTAPPSVEAAPSNGEGPAGPRERYGVLASWEMGNFISCEGLRPAVWSRFPQPPASAWLIAEGETEADERLAEVCSNVAGVRYVVLDERTVTTSFPGHVAYAKQDWQRYRGEVTRRVLGDQPLVLRTYGTPYQNSTAYRLYYRDGSGWGNYRLVYECPDQAAHAYLVVPGGQAARLAVRDEKQLARLRDTGEGEVVHTPNGLLHDGSRHSSVKIFERVPGALATGIAAPGVTVRASLRLRSDETGREFSYEQSAVAGGDGSFALRLPYPTHGESETDVRSIGAYRFEVRGDDSDFVASRSVRVDEEEVRNGREIPLGQLETR